MGLLRSYLNYKQRRGFYNRDKQLLKLHNLPNLTSEELNEIKKTWPCLNISEKDLIYTKMHKKVYGFSPYFINDYQLNEILLKTNPYKQVVSLQNKAMLDVYFNELPLPNVILRGIAGVIYNHDMDVVTTESAAEILKGHSQFVIKPAVDTGCGKGVQKLSKSEFSNISSFCDLLKSYGRDFIVQEVLQQQESISELNPTSINACRITSLYINEKFGHSTIMKIGKKGAKVDNWNCGYLIGVNNDGTLKEFGFDDKLNQVTKTDTGIGFSGFKIPHYEAMVYFVQKYHVKYFPNCGIVGWDIIVDNNNNVRIIEVNLDFPGVVGEQLCSGTFFEDFRDKICSLFSMK